MAKFSNYLEFYEEKVGGGFESGDPSCYKIEGDSLETIANIEETLWQAVEIDGFDNRKVLVKTRIDKDGKTVHTGKFYIETNIVRTDVPSRYIVWGDKEPHIFEVDRKRSCIKLHIMLPCKIDTVNMTFITETEDLKNG